MRINQALGNLRCFDEFFYWRTAPEETQQSKLKIQNPIMNPGQ